MLRTVSLTGTSASLSLAFQTSGEHRITAIYSGSLDDAGSTSPALVQVVRTASTTTLISTPNLSLPGEAATIAASVSPASAHDSALGPCHALTSPA